MPSRESMVTRLCAYPWHSTQIRKHTSSQGLPNMHMVHTNQDCMAFWYDMKFIYAKPAVSSICKILSPLNVATLIRYYSSLEPQSSVVVLYSTSVEPYITIL